MSKTILLVDDQDLMIRIVQAALRPLNVLTPAVRSGLEAVRFVREVRVPDGVILDYSMPEQDGVETLRQIRDLPGGANIPVVILTARDQTLIREAAGGLGVFDFVTKPFSPTALAATAKRMLEVPN